MLIEYNDKETMRFEKNRVYLRRNILSISEKSNKSDNCAWVEWEKKINDETLTLYLFYTQLSITGPVM